jgi:hypothetical protein
MNKFYIYLHIRLDTEEVFYVGKGSGYRARMRYKRNSYWNRIVAKAGYRIEYAAKELTEAEAFRKEVETIAHYRALGQACANLTDGGEGNSGWAPSEETKAKLSAANRGTVFSPEHKEKLSKSRKMRKEQPRTGIAHSKEARAKISLAHRGKVLNAKTREKMSLSKLSPNNPIRKQVLCLDTGQIFGSITQAANTLGCSISQVSKACSGKVLKVKGYKFTYI